MSKLYVKINFIFRILFIFVKNPDTSNETFFKKLPLKKIKESPVINEIKNPFYVTNLVITMCAKNAQEHFEKIV